MGKKIRVVKVINTNKITEDIVKGLEQLLENKCDFTVELCLYDIICDEQTEKIGNKLARKYPQSVFYHKMDGGLRTCFNAAMADISADWVQFSRITATYSSDVIEELQKVIEECDVSLISMAPIQSMNDQGEDPLSFTRRNCMIDLLELPFYVQPVLDACFIKCDIIQGTKLAENVLEESAMENFLACIYDNIKKYYIMGKKCMIEEYLFNDQYNYPPLYERRWYTEEINQLLLPFIKENQDSFIRQATVFQSVQLKMAGNENDRYKNILFNHEIDEFLEAVSQLLQYVDDDILIQTKWQHKRILPDFMVMSFLRLKYGKTWFPVKNVRNQDKSWEIAVDGRVIEKYEDIVFDVQAINTEERGLVLEGELINVYFADFDDIRMYLCYEGKKYSVERTEIYSLFKYFGRTVKKGYKVRAVLPEEVYVKDNFKFYFRLEFQNYSGKLKCKFKKFQARLTKKTARSYWRFGNHILRYYKDKDVFVIKNSNLARSIYYETRLLLSLCRMKYKKRSSVSIKRVFLLRMVYFLTKPYFSKREIWVTYDQLFKGGDNGEYFFRYVRKNHKDIDMYYIVNEDTKEYRDLKKRYGKVLKYGKMWTKLIALHAKILFATRVNVKLYCGIEERDAPFVKDLFHAQVVCLQHGLTIQKIAQYQNKLFDNIRYYYCVSPYEVENIKKPIYGYTEDMIALTGAPRYDGLVGKPKKQILITPTWRRNVTAGTNEKGKQHEYSVNFKSTKYFEVYNRLINDSQLIECARRTGYKLIYLLHPILSPQIGDFDQNKYVEIWAGAKVDYETILKESCLMVTDYSGIQFDFAYMKKPLIYYRPTELPAQYEEEDFGFGPVCQSHREIVESLCEYMENGCRLSDNSREHIESFFPYSDQRNCERVYDATIKKFGRRGN